MRSLRRVSVVIEIDHAEFDPDDLRKDFPVLQQKLFDAVDQVIPDHSGLSAEIMWAKVIVTRDPVKRGEDVKE